MRCHICDKALSEPNFNAELNAYEPCPECLAVIQDTIAGFHDRPAVQEDELGVRYLETLEGLSPEDLADLLTP